MGLGIENTGAGLQSQFLVSADRFAIVNTIAGGAISVLFAVQGGHDLQFTNNSNGVTIDSEFARVVSGQVTNFPR
ncbi:hypothetical protein CQ009_22840 [Pseudomonas sp. MYb2]|nr:hypothetical protein CQ025_23615 [Pseudomonas sp. MYb3]PRC31426.1 hypothetical protein CQ009_22840 [Pseudomonas sp. MYb2]